MTIAVCLLILNHEILGSYLINRTPKSGESNRLDRREALSQNTGFSSIPLLQHIVEEGVEGNLSCYRNRQNVHLGDFRAVAVAYDRVIAGQSGGGCHDGYYSGGSSALHTKAHGLAVSTCVPERDKLVCQVTRLGNADTLARDCANSSPALDCAHALIAIRRAKHKAFGVAVKALAGSIIIVKQYLVLGFYGCSRHRIGIRSEHQ
ncbi:MAG: hypothetical protein WCS37_19055, partial [Chloroflexota bacterium]